MVARLDRSEALSLVLNVAERFRGAGFNVFFEPCLAERIGERDFSMPLKHMKTDLIVTIGGDGTILRTCLRIPKPEPPILAIGMGARGFLTEVLPEKALEAVDRYIEGSYHVETCRKISSFIGDTRLPDALNEVFITSRHLAKTLSVRIWKNGVAVADFSADGVIIASQVGSTAYSFSSGGPILDPEVDALVLTPVCPISLMRSMVFPSSSRVTVELLKPKAAMIVIDGDYQKNIGDGETKVTVRFSEHKSSFIRFEDSFYKRLKDRLLYSREEG
jgi:NAD+ kinase